MREVVGSNIWDGVVKWFTLRTSSVDDTTWWLMYKKGIREARYPMPALIQSVDYWPEDATDNGKPLCYYMEHYKPGKWRQWLKAGEGENDV